MSFATVFYNANTKIYMVNKRQIVCQRFAPTDTYRNYKGVNVYMKVLSHMMKHFRSGFLEANEGWVVPAPGRLPSEGKVSFTGRMLQNPLQILIEQTLLGGKRPNVACLAVTSVFVSHLFSSGL